jgi:dGTPase
MHLEIFAVHHDQVLRRYPDVEPRRLVSEVIRSMINTLVLDLTHTTQARILALAPQSVDELRAGPPVAAFSPTIQAQADALKQFLLRNLYRHSQVMRMMGKARRVVRELFQAFLDDPRLLADEYRRDDPVEQARAIADYIAGMTDRYAIREHRALFRMD